MSQHRFGGKNNFPFTLFVVDSKKNSLTTKRTFFYISFLSLNRDKEKKGREENHLLTTSLRYWTFFGALEK